MLKNLTLLFFVLFSQFAFGQEPDIAIIMSSRAASNAAIARHDIDGMSKFWLNDFVQTIGKGSSLTGKDTIIGVWKVLFKTNAKVIYIRKPTQVVLGDNRIMAWETGTWEAQNSYSKGGNYSAMWRKVDGKWKLQAELFVSLRQ